MKQRITLLKVLFSLSVLTMVVPARAQDAIGLWSSIGLDYDLPKGTAAGLETEYRLNGGMCTTDRWSVGANVSKRLYRNAGKTFSLKLEAGYKFMNVLVPQETKYKDEGFYIDDELVMADYNLLGSGWQNRHRASATISAAYEPGRFKFSLKEKYQYTCKSGFTRSREKHTFDLDTDKLDNEGIITWKEYVTNGTKEESASDSHVLRSRFQASYNIPHWKYDPFVSYELFTRLDGGIRNSKIRLSVGFDFNINKVHNFKFTYLWQDNADDDEAAGSALGIGYVFAF